ncbi:MAG: hypothetical protein DRP29_00500 [Thermodesulfobacteriota bacterium]|nr:MAG: hypothetical protein DRP29_00500 [Thermodesulfobacteriota bacterium]
MEIARVRKVGHSWAVCIKQKYWQKIGVKLGDWVIVKNTSQGLVLKKLNLKEDENPKHKN